MTQRPRATGLGADAIRPTQTPEMRTERHRAVALATIRPRSILELGCRLPDGHVCTDVTEVAAAAHLRAARRAHHPIGIQSRLEYPFFPFSRISFQAADSNPSRSGMVVAAVRIAFGSASRMMTSESASAFAPSVL